jgi:hypothetical protein
MTTETLIPTFTLEQLLFASEMLFPETYGKLLKKHTTDSVAEIRSKVKHYAHECGHKSSLFSLLKSIPRNDPKSLELLSIMLKDLIGDYV